MILLPPVGYEYWTAHRTLRVLAERLAATGHAALRIDYDGTGDSSGDQADPDRWASWSASAGAAVDFLRAAGIGEITLAGLRLGAAIALTEALREPVDRLVLAVPVVSGRRYRRELSLMGAPVPESAGDRVEEGTVVFAGTVFSPETLRALDAVGQTDSGAAPAPRVLVVDRVDGSGSDALVGHLQGLGVDVSHQHVDGVAIALDRPTEEAEAALELVDAVTAWIGSRAVSDGDVPYLPERPETAMAWRGQELREEFVELGENRLAGVRTWAVDSPPATVVFLNSGSETHIGPGRTWVELARDLALAGYEALRVDFRGWGESPDDGFAPGRPYDLHTWEDAADIVGALRNRANPEVFLAGVCAGAWVSLKEATRTDVDGVIAINPQMYWQPGDPVEALITDTRQRRLPEIEYWKRQGAELERTEPAHPAGEWLEQLRAREVPTLALFSRGDDGLEFLESRLPATWQAALDSGVIELVEVDIDHPLHQYWQRGALSDAITGFLARRRG